MASGNFYVKTNTVVPKWTTPNQARNQINFFGEGTYLYVDSGNTRLNIYFKNRQKKEKHVKYS